MQLHDQMARQLCTARNVATRLRQIRSMFPGEHAGEHPKRNRQFRRKCVGSSIALALGGSFMNAGTDLFNASIDPFAAERGHPEERS
eukprot:2494089-Amphidinium_carterae.1